MIGMIVAAPLLSAATHVAKEIRRARARVAVAPAPPETTPLASGP
jgi:hypothetical protein